MRTENQKALETDFAKLDELIGATLKLRKCAAEQGFVIHSMAVMKFWYSTPIEIPPKKILGINITNPPLTQ